MDINIYMEVRFIKFNEKSILAVKTIGVRKLNLDRWILVLIILTSIIVLLKFVPLKKLRDAVILFLSLQMLTWPLGLIAVEMKWIEYPVQLLPNENQTNKSSLLFEYFLFPLLAILFSLYFPKSKNKMVIVMYYLIITGIFTILEVVIERYTDLAHYNTWRWYWTFISVLIVLFINHSYYSWYKKDLVAVSKVNYE
ncbi:CBO0543 family protein [Bacillus sp. X1(2014)]|uniref:CBO0543 family protein n=1 Tax=Bacillus sp. X1(2014) TaxID=1565991 RepID=UPI0028CB8699|nr:CBO0543 family protein [Bacillus sp. X1(2014)]